MEDFENRRHFRLRELIDITWKHEDQEESGEGTVVNISSSGLLLQTDRLFKVSDQSVLSFGSKVNSLPLAGKKGRVMWYRRIVTPHERYQCGIQLLEDNSDRDFQQWLGMKIDRLSEALNINILSNLAYL